MALNPKRPNSSTPKTITPGYPGTQQRGAQHRSANHAGRSSHAARSAHARADREFRTYDTSYIAPKKSKAPVVLGVVLAIAVVAIAAVLIVPRLSGVIGGTSVDLLPEGQSAIVVIEEGSTGKEIGNKLVDAKLVGSVREFTNRVESMGASAKLIPGTYEFKGGMTIDQIIETLTIGPAATADTVTVPEGFTIAKAAAAIEEGTQGRITAQQFIDAASDASKFAAEFPFLADVGTGSLEGFLFPKTYSITAADDATSVVRMMLRQFQTEIAGLSFAYPEGEGLSLYEAVNLASIVEKESAADNRSTVASVFYNRLAISMPLQSDATTAYEVGHDPTADEVHADTPYGTYANYGLPPTPICSPSLDSLQAVCTPTETNYLYFYFTSNADGSMNYYFSENYEQHQYAIANG